MAIGATVYKAELNVSDINRHYYNTHDLTVALHPSENEFRLMTRIIVFAHNAHEQLSFTKGLSTEGEPELWCKNLSDEIDLWIDLGQVDEKRIRKACGKAKQVKIYTYDTRKAEVWWQQNEKTLQRHNNLSVYHLYSDALEQLIARKMQLQCQIQDDEIYLGDGNTNLTVRVEEKQTSSG